MLPPRPPVRRCLAAVLSALAVGLGGCAGEGPGPTSPGRPPSAALPPESPPPSAGPTGAGRATSPPGGAFDAARVAVTLEPIVGGLEDPLAVTHAGDGGGRLFVAQQGGQVRIVDGGRLAARPFLDIADRVRSGGERGLLGLAFHPAYPDDPRLFVDYTDENGDTRVSSFEVDPADPARADPDSEVRLLFVEQPFPNHNGGALAFGPDGFLYVATGDGGSGGDPQGFGQRLDTLLGKVLRIDVDRTEGERAYGIPADNPFARRAGAAPEIWLYGLRNPWRMAFDRATGDLWLGDVGQGAWEEVDVARAGAGGGANYGWNTMEGNHCFRPPSGCDETTSRPPVAEYSHDLGCTVIGGHVYRGTDQPSLVGGYLFADYCSGLVFAIAAAGDEAREPVVVLESDATISSFGEDEAGELYATDLVSGELYLVAGASR